MSPAAVFIGARMIQQTTIETLLDGLRKIGGKERASVLIDSFGHAVLCMDGDYVQSGSAEAILSEISEAAGYSEQHARDVYYLLRYGEEEIIGIS